MSNPTDDAVERAKALDVICERIHAYIGSDSYMPVDPQPSITKRGFPDVRGSHNFLGSEFIALAAAYQYAITDSAAEMERIADELTTIRNEARHDAQEWLVNINALIAKLRGKTP